MRWSACVVFYDCEYSMYSRLASDHSELTASASWVLGLKASATMPDLIYNFWKLFKSTFSYFLSLKFLGWQKSMQFWSHWHWLSFKRPTLRGKCVHLEYARGLQNTIKTPSDINGQKRSQPSLKTSACSPSECGQWDFCAVLVAGVWQAKEKARKQLNSSLLFPIIKSTEGLQRWEVMVLKAASRALQGNWGKIRFQDGTEKFLLITGRRNLWPSATQPVQMTGAGGALCTPFLVAFVTLLSSVSDRSDTHIFISNHSIYCFRCLDRSSITSLVST